MSKIPSPLLQMESWPRCLGGFSFSCSGENCVFFFAISVLIYFGEEDLVYYYLFTSQRESHSVPDVDYFAIPSFILSHLELLRKPKWVTKTNFKCFNGNCDYSSCPSWSILFLYPLAHEGLAFWKNCLSARLSLSQFIFAFSYSFKITCILLRQVISLKKKVALSAKFTILISWPPICIPLIHLSALMKLASTSAAILYNKMESSPLANSHRG